MLGGRILVIKCDQQYNYELPYILVKYMIGVYPRKNMEIVSKLILFITLY